MKLLPIGSVLQVKGKKAIILGYRFDDENNKFTTSYVICGYPLGFLTMEQLGLVSVDADMEVVFEGYRNELFYSFIRNKQELHDLATTMLVSEWNDHLEQIEESIGGEE